MVTCCWGRMHHAACLDGGAILFYGVVMAIGNPPNCRIPLQRRQDSVRKVKLRHRAALLAVESAPYISRVASVPPA